jgi:hypothetical protein
MCGNGPSHYIICIYIYIEGSEVLTAVMRSSIFGDIRQGSPFKINDVSKEHVTYIFSVAVCFILVCLAYSSTLKTEAMLLRNVG